MSIKYESKQESLADILKKATINATYVIPDLQRPYVWTPRQVTLLIDSLFRGWPFGSLLLWEVETTCFPEDEGIPHRPFWQVIDRTGNDQGSQNSAIGQPATYHMVLDGQQRVQSLILALGGDQWGFQLYDADWSLDLRERRVRPSNHWSKGSLCLDLEKFREELKEKENTVRKLEVYKILEWAILDSTFGQSTEPRSANYVYPLETTKENPGRFIRLSRFWDLAHKGLSEGEYKNRLEPMLKKHCVSDSDYNKLIEPLAVFMKVVEDVKENSFVHALQIDSFELTEFWTKDDYCDAIVNIFTRLNTAGRTLTREEITLAWLKVGWVSAETAGKTAGQCLEELQSAFEDRRIHLETDEIVRLISFIWSVEYNHGNLLDSKLLLKGEIVRTVAKSIASVWKKLKPRLEQGVDLIKERDLSENQGSFNAIIIFLAWNRLVFDRFEVISDSMDVRERDSVEKKLKHLAGRFLDRWIFGSQWANVWGEGALLNFQNFASDLNGFWVKLKECSGSNLIITVEESINQLMGRIINKAKEQIDNTVVRDRRRVYIYYPLLWIWHRLDQARWIHSSVPMRIGRKRTSKLEVDHTVADAWWQQLVDREIQAKLENFVRNDEEKAQIAPDEFESESDARAFINLLGNCSLLEKSFNISKSDKAMREFLQEVHEFKEEKMQLNKWETALSLPETLTDPKGATLMEIKKAVQARDALIRKELTDFIFGSKVRMDL